MKNISSKIVLISSLFALTSVFAIPAVRAEGAAPVEKKVNEKDLAKYDTNKDGKLDDAEKAVMKEEKAKHRKHKAKAADKAEAPAQEK